MTAPLHEMESDLTSISPSHSLSPSPSRPISLSLHMLHVVIYTLFLLVQCLLTPRLRERGRPARVQGLWGFVLLQCGAESKGSHTEGERGRRY